MWRWAGIVESVTRVTSLFQSLLVTHHFSSYSASEGAMLSSKSRLYTLVGFMHSVASLHILIKADFIYPVSLSVVLPISSHLSYLAIIQCSTRDRSVCGKVCIFCSSETTGRTNMKLGTIYHNA